MNRSPKFLWLLLSGVLSFSLSCKKGKEQPPVPMEKMQQVLLDIQLAESYSQGLGAGQDSNMTRFDKNYDSLRLFYSVILTHYDMSFAAFDKAMTWYKDHPDQLDTLCARVLDELNTQKAQRGIRDEPDKGTAGQAPADSVKAAPPLPAQPPSRRAIKDTLPLRH